MYKTSFQRRYYKKAFQRHYYVEYCPWGIDVSYHSFGGNAYRYFAFDSKRERESWLKRHEYNRAACKVVAAPITRRNMEGRIGAFQIITANSWRDDGEVIIDGIIDEVMSKEKAARLGLDPFTNSRNI